MESPPHIPLQLRRNYEREIHTLRRINYELEVEIEKTRSRVKQWQLISKGLVAIVLIDLLIRLLFN